MARSGVYQIINRINGHRYVGSSINMSKRLGDHFSYLRCGRHDNPRLQRAFNKYGAENFYSKVVELCSEELLEPREQHYLDNWKPEYNIAKFAYAGMRGRKHSRASRRRMSEALKGRVLTEEHKARIAEAHRGKIQAPHTEETKRKMSEAHKGKKHRSESIEKMRKVQSGKKLSKEHCKKIGISKSKPVVRVCPKTGAEKHYKSITATKKDGFNISNVARVCAGKRARHKSYLWHYSMEVTYR